MNKINLYRIKNLRTGKYYRHKYSQFRGGDWVDVDQATVWTKPGGVNGASALCGRAARTTLTS